MITCNIAIVGGGTSGLALATELRRLGPSMSVVVLERETEGWRRAAPLRALPVRTA